MGEEDERSLESFLKWAAELGVTDSPRNSVRSQNPNPSSCLGHSLYVSDFPGAGGRGLGAVRDIRKGELVLRVPKSALLTRESLMRDEKLSIAINKHSYLSSTQILAVCLLYEMGKGKSSWWHPYLIHIPRMYDILATFGPFETQSLQVGDAIWAAENARLKAELEWKEANAVMEALNLKPQLLTFQAWLWASATISSRTMHIPWDSAGCLCPVGDLFNYDAPGEEHIGLEDVENGTLASSLQVNSLCDSAEKLDLELHDTQSQRLTDGVFEADCDAYCFYARKSYKKGEQVLLCYGTYTNLELLEHYGFLLDENPNDKIFIPLEPDINSSTSWPRDSLFIHQNGKPSFALLSALRLWATPPNQRRSVGHIIYSGSQLSSNNEISVMKWISKKCHQLLDLPTSINEDTLLLSSIEKLDELHDPTELRGALSTLGSEFFSLMETNKRGQNGSSVSERILYRKTKRCMDRWRLAVQWRLRYKKTLADCVSYCTETIDSILSQNSTTENRSKPNLLGI